MEVNQLIPMIEELEISINDLEENLELVVETALSTTTRKLPLLDRAKLYVLVCYAIESVIFCLLCCPGD